MDSSDDSRRGESDLVVEGEESASAGINFLLPLPPENGSLPGAFVPSELHPISEPDDARTKNQPPPPPRES